MPLTKLGKKMHKRFQKEYGIILGNKVFYAFINKHPKRTKRWERK